MSKYNKNDSISKISMSNVNLNETKLRTYNNYNFDNYDEILDYVDYKIIPKNIKNKTRFQEKYDNFINIDNNLVLKGTRIPVMRNNNEDKEEILNYLHDTYPAHGINKFYQIVSHYALNIKKRETIEFLKNKTTYQLTREYKKTKVETKQYKEENVMWQIDLIDMSKNKHKNYRYILTVIDLFNQKVFLSALHDKTSESVKESLEEIFEFAGITPKSIQSDNGMEFQQQNNFPNIKFIKAPSHTPLAYVEKMNGEIRQKIRYYSVKNKSNNWVKFLPDIENNINHFNLEIKKQKTKDDIKKENPDDFKSYVPKLKVNDFVRIKLSVIDSRVRLLYKEHLNKHIAVKWSVMVFQINKVFLTKKANALPYYSLTYPNSDELVKHDEDRSVARYKENDLLKVNEHNDGEFSLKEANKINRLN